MKIFIAPLVFICCLTMAGKSFSQPRTPIDVYPVFIGMTKTQITDILIQKYLQLKDTPEEIVFQIEEGVYYTVGFDDTFVAWDFAITYTSENHYLAMQLLIKDSEWKCQTSDPVGDMDPYFHRLFPKLDAFLVSDQDGTSFYISINTNK